MPVLRLNNVKQLSASAYRFIKTIDVSNKYTFYGHTPDKEVFDIKFIEKEEKITMSQSLFIFANDPPLVELWYGKNLEGTAYIESTTGNINYNTEGLLTIRYRS